MHASPFGAYIKQKRIEAGLSLRDIAAALGVTHVYLGEVERGRHRAMPEEHWAGLTKAIPGVTRRELKAAADASEVIDPRDLGQQDQQLVISLARRIKAHSLTDDEYKKLMRILGDENVGAPGGDNDRAKKKA